MNILYVVLTMAASSKKSSTFHDTSLLGAKIERKTTENQHSQ
jgi:hypothetical protein